MADGRGDRATIREITDAADVGFGTFYNHFASKAELFRAATEEVLERWGRTSDTESAGLEDPAEVFAVSLRLSEGLAWTHPEIAGFVTGRGLDLLGAPSGLGPRALRDIRAAQAADRFTVADAEVALSAVAGGLLGLLRLRERDPGRVDESSVDNLTGAACACSASPGSRLDAWPACRYRRRAVDHPVSSEAPVVRPSATSVSR
jgi:AcrR family transcriptional regulator